MHRHSLIPLSLLLLAGAVAAAEPPAAAPIAGDRIAYAGPHSPATAHTVVDVHGLAVSPGFVNMLAHPEESLLVDGRALSDLAQGVTLEAMGEDSMGPLNPEMKKLMVERQGDIKFPVTWSTLGEYLTTVEKR